MTHSHCTPRLTLVSCGTRVPALVNSSSMAPLVPPFTGLLSPPTSAGALVRAHSAVRRWSALLCLSQAQPQGPRAPALASRLQLVSLHRGRAHSHPTELPLQPFSLPPSLSRWGGGGGRTASSSLPASFQPSLPWVSLGCCVQ